MIKQFMADLKEEKNGFKFGKVFRLDEESVVAILPIIQEIEAERDYITMPEAENIAIEDTGSINSTKVTNNGSKPVYIRSGTMLKGQTQERATTIDRIIFPNKTEVIEVVCIHQTKGIMAGTKMNYSGLTPSSIDLNSQRGAWESVRICCSVSESSSPSFSSSSARFDSDDLTSYYVGSYTEKIEKILPKIKYRKNQAGMVIFDVEGVYAIDVFDVTKSWKALRDDIVKKDGEKIMEKDLQGIFQLKPERANELAMAVLGQTYTEKLLHKNGSESYSLKNDKYVGEATILNNKVIHFNLLRNK